MTMTRRWALCLLTAMATAVLPAPAESLTMSLDKPTALHFLRAATPYKLEVTKFGLTENFTFYNPRELRFEEGHIRLLIDCRAEPIIFETILEPTLSVSFDRMKNAFVVKVESLPVRIGRLGTINLDNYIDPVVIPVSFKHPLDIGVEGLSVETIIRGLKVHEDRIEAKADLIFRKEPPATMTSQER